VVRPDLASSRSLPALLLAALPFLAGQSALAQSAPPPPPVTVSHPLEREIVEWDEYTGQFAAVE